MEGDQREIARIWFIGKLRARAPSPIRMGYRDLPSIEMKTEASARESEDRVEDKQQDMGVGDHIAVQVEGKKKNPPSSQLEA